MIHDTYCTPPASFQERKASGDRESETKYVNEPDWRISGKWDRNHCNCDHCIPVHTYCCILHAAYCILHHRIITVPVLFILRSLASWCHAYGMSILLFHAYRWYLFFGPRCIHSQSVVARAFASQMAHPSTLRNTVPYCKRRGKNLGTGTSTSTSTIHAMMQSNGLGRCFVWAE